MVHTSYSQHSYCPLFSIFLYQNPYSKFSRHDCTGDPPIVKLPPFPIVMIDITGAGKLDINNQNTRSAVELESDACMLVCGHDIDHSTGMSGPCTTLDSQSFPIALHAISIPEKYLPHRAIIENTNHQCDHRSYCHQYSIKGAVSGVANCQLKTKYMETGRHRGKVASENITVGSNSYENVKTFQ